MCDDIQGTVQEYLERVKAHRAYLAGLSEPPADEAAPGVLIGTPPSDDGYDSLRAIYAMALEQAQGGKGRERHANGMPFDQQPICQGGRRFGPGCLIYQAWKKAHETPVLMNMDNGTERAIRELLGVINYAAAAILVIKEGGDAVE